VLAWSNTRSVQWWPVDPVDLSFEGVERLRRSVAMLTRGQPALDREAAMTVLAELQRLQRQLRGTA
jgi:hypothetical protein